MRKEERHQRSSAWRAYTSESPTDLQYSCYHDYSNASMCHQHQRRVPRSNGRGVLRDWHKPWTSSCNPRTPSRLLAVGDHSSVKSLIHRAPLRHLSRRSLNQPASEFLLSFGSYCTTSSVTSLHPWCWSARKPIRGHLYPFLCMLQWLTSQMVLLWRNAKAKDPHLQR